jgi:hypothetical protein
MSMKVHYASDRKTLQFDSRGLSGNREEWFETQKLEEFDEVGGNSRKF